MMNILVTGGMGFIGRNLTGILTNQGHKVRILDLQGQEDNLPINCEFIEADFNSEIDYTTILKEIDVVFHLISTTVPGIAEQNKVFDITSNVGGTLKFLDAIIASQVSKLIFISSGGTVYGEATSDTVSELHETNPICSYGIHKLTIEKYLYYYHVKYGLDYQIIRLSNPYGKGQDGKKGQGIIPIFANHLKEKEPIQVFGDGNIVRDYIHINDVVNALVKFVSYKGNERIFNLGTGRGTSILEIIETLQVCSGIEATIEFIPNRSIDVKRNVLDITKIRKEIDWNPEISLEEGIKDYLR
ncbi:MAG: NAD-dependent epimerase/dehydratase family protein [Clostridiales bacterium]|nr:NAD-dependent epimerase/dehydratase family protein [Clostridiales bacterium]MDU6361429.1 NAD-dependent epimerase/dehydratase family protein [Clostridiales bacterium]